MPELLTLLPCERVIIDEQTKVPTLVMIVEAVEVEVPEGSVVPNNVVVPKDWVVFTIWGKTDGEGPGHYTQIIEIIPAGKGVPPVRVKIDFDFPDQLHKLQNRVLGFPVGGTGVCSVRVWLESSAGVASKVHSFPIKITHKYVKPTTGNLTLAETANS